MPTIFVVDDDAVIRKGLSLSLKERGFKVESFDSAQAFLDAPNLYRSGCLILDVQMPRMTGLELQAIMLERGITLPIIFVSGHGTIPMAAQAMRQGAIDFLEKPYALDVLLACIHEALSVDKKSRTATIVERVIRSRFECLSEREREVMTLLVAGVANTSNRVIAEQLGLSQRTIDTYRQRLMKKMHARSLPDLVEMARLCGVYQP